MQSCLSVCLKLKILETTKSIGLCSSWNIKLFWIILGGIGTSSSYVKMWRVHKLWHLFYDTKTYRVATLINNIQILSTISLLWMCLLLSSNSTSCYWKTAVSFRRLCGRWWSSWLATRAGRIWSGWRAGRTVFRAVARIGSTFATSLC